MLKKDLIVELEKRHANTLGSVKLLKDRLCAYIDRDIENSYTHGDRDSREGHPLQNLQMDNAKPHIGNENIQNINRKLEEEKWESHFIVNLTVQPPRSPDLNKLDMSINRSLASKIHTYKVRSHNLDDLVINVVREFEDYPIEYLERAYAETFAIYREILHHDGGNDFSIPHEGIRSRQSRSESVVDLYVDVALVERAKAWLVANPLPDIP